MKNAKPMQRAVDDDTTFDQQSAERHRIVRAVAGDLQRSGEPQMRAAAVSGFDRQRVAGGAGRVDRYGLCIGPVVENADDGVTAAIGHPLGECSGYRWMRARTDEDQMHIAGEIGPHQPGLPPIGPAAEVGGKTIMVEDFDAICRQQGGPQRQPATHHVDCDPVRRRLRPARQISAHDLRGRDFGAINEHGDAGDVGGRAIKVTNSGEEAGGADWLRHMQFGRKVRLVAFAPRAAEQRRRIAERAEEIAEVIRRTQAPRLREIECIGREPPQMEADVANVVPAFILRHRADIDRVRDLVERAVEPVHAFDRADVGGAL